MRATECRRPLRRPLMVARKQICCRSSSRLRKKGNDTSGPFFSGLLRSEVFLFRTVVFQVVAGVVVPMPTSSSFQRSTGPDLEVHAFVAETVSEKFGGAIAVDVACNLSVLDTERLLRIDNRNLNAGALPFRGSRSNGVPGHFALEIATGRQLM